MINLLPPQLKEEYHYARRNTGLLHWLMMFGFGLVGLVLVVAVGLVYLGKQATAYDDQAVAIQENLKTQQQDQVQNQAKELSNDLKLSVQVLSQEILFSQLLKQMAINTPSNVSLSGLNIAEVKGGVDITAKTTDYNAATQLQVNLTDPANKIFEKADIISINCTTSTSRYPCNVVVRALFADNNPFLFINSKVKS